MSNDAVMREVYIKTIAPYETSFGKNNREVIEKVCTTDKYAFLSDSTVIASTAKNLKCSIQEVPKAYIDVLLSLVIQKRSPYLGVFRHL